MAIDEDETPEYGMDEAKDPEFQPSYGEVEWRGPATVLWTVQLCDLTIAGIALGASFIYLKFMLIPLTMAYMVTYVMAPVLDVLEKRPFGFRGKELCANAATDPKRYEIEYDETEEEVEGKTKVVKTPRLDEEGNHIFKLTENGNKIFKTGLAGAAQDFVLMGKFPHGIACLLTLCISFGVLGGLFALITSSFGAFLDEEAAKEEKGEESIGMKLNDMLNDQIDSSGIEILTSIDCLYPNMTDIQVSTSTYRVADYFEASVGCVDVLNKRTQDEKVLMREDFEESGETLYCTTLFKAEYFHTMGTTTDFEYGDGTRQVINDASDEEDCATKVEAVFEGGAYNFYDAGKFCVGYSIPSASKGRNLAAAWGDDYSATTYPASTTVTWGFTDLPNCDKERIENQRNLVEKSICQGRYDDSHDVYGNAVDDLEDLGFGYILTAMDYDDTYLKEGAAKFMAVCPITCSTHFDETLASRKLFQRDEMESIKFDYFDNQIMPVAITGFQRYSSFDAFGNCTKEPLFGAGEEEYDFDEIVLQLQAALLLFSDVILVVMLAIFILLERPEGRTFDGEHPMVEEIEFMINQYIQLKTAISFATGLCVGLILTICGVQLSIIFGLLAFLLNFIPSIGSIIASILPIPIIVLDDNLSSTTKIIAIVGPMCVQGYIGNGLEPVLFGAALNITTISVLLALVVFGYVWGLCGAVLSTIFMGVIKIVANHTDHAVSKGILKMVCEDEALLWYPGKHDKEKEDEEGDGITLENMTSEDE